MYDNPKKSDWKLFRSMLPELRERYLDKVNKEIEAILCDPEKSSTESFWCAEERIEEEAGILRDCLDGYSKSSMCMKIELMRHYGMMGEEDLDRFSEELQELIRRV